MNTTGEFSNELLSGIVQPEQDTDADDTDLDDLEAEDQDGETTDSDDADLDTEDVDDETGEDDEDDAHDDDSDDEPLYTVTVDGQEQEVTLSELRRGYSGQKFIQQGMQRAARVQRESQAAFAALQQERQKLAALVQQAQSGAIPSAPTAPDQALMTTDPMRFAIEQQQYMAAKEQYDTAMQQYAQQSQQQSEAEQQAMQTYVRQQVESLVLAEPDLAQREKAQAFQQSLLAAGQAYGYSPEEIGGLIDHRAMLILRDAGRYRELMANGGNAQSLASKAKKGKRTKVLRAGGKRRTSSTQRAARQKQNQRFAQTGDIRDAVDLMVAPQ